MRFALLFTLLLLIIGSKVEAQIDPSSAMLLNPGKANVRDSGLDSGRYTVKPRSDGHPVRKNETRSRAIEETTPAPTPAATVAATATPSPQFVGPQKPPQRPPQDLPEFGPQDFESPQAVRTPTDLRRLNLLELSFAPGYMYNESKSSFTPRNYYINSPTGTVDAGIWINPNLGVHTSFTGTINANVNDSLNNTKNATASSQWFAAGIRSRTFFGESAKSPTLTFGLDYREYSFRTPSDTLLRNKLTTSGLHLTMEAELPTDGFGAFTIGGEFGPKLSHRETSNAIEFRSGESPEATAVEVHVGAKYRFDRANALFWKISYGVERDQFSGFTTVSDPVTGMPQTDVGVTNAFTLFQLGYSWGN